MNDYEILLLLAPDLDEDRENEIVARTRETIERGGGEWDRDDVWGRRKLAFEIAHNSEGTYHLLLFRSSPEVLEEVSRVLRITDGVLRHLAVRRPKPSAGASARPAPPERAEAAAQPEQSAVQEAG